MKYLAILIFGSSLFIACSDSKDEKVTSEVKKTVESSQDAGQQVNVVANRVLKMEVTGMSCEMACGGSIREALIETGAVSRVEFVDFDMDKATNIAKVYFDKEKINVGKIKSIVTTINEHQFTVGETSSEAYEVDVKADTNTPSKVVYKVEAAEVCVESPSMELPNLIDLFKSVVL